MESACGTDARPGSDTAAENCAAVQPVFCGATRTPATCQDAPRYCHGAETEEGEGAVKGGIITEEIGSD